ncbi:MAG: Orotidine 5'-phosphate decarboxylase [Berkelbacteria bacterium GW2011_GWA2_46_7]|uniref:Orotidine-5'-phosphate decarboxylase n=1 Tax=Berkelbacteria bacterium GW2011_GWA2_46_7 TaxID=1618335 RepID=A0A0G1QGH1_9BACT|nr:MAG: Orotidine 5'-phosphate decarboxylase [Berkelbacteria bacterium GW2011_GWA2_46_7]
MSERNFMGMLQAKWHEGKFVCVGLDSDLEKIPARVQGYDDEETLINFTCTIVDATKSYVCAYKPNMAFYEAVGASGFRALRHIINYIGKVAPDVPIIYDAKHGDIGNTNNGYVAAAFDLLGADAITINPYLGRQAMQPFLDRVDKGIIILCKTSNPGADEFQDLEVSTDWAPEGTIPLYQYVAMKVARDWNDNGNCLLVVGAPYPEDLGKVRAIVGDMPLLIPGVGFQQKEIPLEEQVRLVVANGKDSQGQGMIINSSRGIIFASSGDDFAEAARRETQHLHDQITVALD